MNDAADDFSKLDLSDDSDVIEDDEDEGVVSVQTQLYPSDGKSDYRTRNSKADPYQRKTGTDRKGVVNIRCKVLDIVHGTLSPEKPTSFATLIVFKCAFFSRKHSRRVKAVDIEMVFKGLGDKAPDPEVVDIAPQGKFGLMPATEEETVTREASGGVSVPIAGGVGGEGLLKWQKVGVRERKKYTTVVGETGLYGRDEGEDDGAGWTLLENPLSKDGVPEAFQGAILLKRRDARSQFQCNLKITVQTDRWTSFANLFESKPLDDPILFDPTLPSTDKLRIYSTNELGQVRLRDFEDINILKLKSGVIDEQ